MISTIFFDFDGVIVESLNIKTEAFSKLFEKEGKKVVKEVIDYHLNNGGVSRYDKFRYIYNEILCRKLSEEAFQELCFKFAKLVKKGVIAAPYVAGAKEFLEKHSCCYKCFILSATPRKEIKEIIKERNITQYFLEVYGAPDKKTDIVRKILQRDKNLPSSAVYVGDAISDYEAAKDNAVQFIARIIDNEDLFMDKDCFKIKDLTDLKGLIDNIR